MVPLICLSSFNNRDLRRNLWSAVDFAAVFFNIGQTWPLYVYFRPFSQHNDKYSTKFDYKQAKHRWFAWNSNLGPQEGKHRQILWAMVALQCSRVSFEVETLLWRWKRNGLPWLNQLTASHVQEVFEYLSLSLSDQVFVGIYWKTKVKLKFV